VIKKQVKNNSVATVYQGTLKHPPNAKNCSIHHVNKETRGDKPYFPFRKTTNQIECILKYTNQDVSKTTRQAIHV
jgi:hypothetical protein